MAPQITLTTERLYLKSMTPAFLHELFATRDKQEIVSLLGLDEEGYDKYKTMHEKGMETHRLSLFVFLLINRQTGLPIGECGFHTWNTYHHRAEVFYGLKNDADKQKGYMTEALRAVLDFGFNELNINRVEAFVASENTPSVKLLMRFGFVKEGIARGHYYIGGKHEDSDFYSLLKQEA